MSFENIDEAFEYPARLTSETMGLKLLTECPDNVMLIFRDLPDINRNLNIQRAIRDICERNIKKASYVPIIIISPMSFVPEMIQNTVELIDLPLFNTSEITRVVRQNSPGIENGDALDIAKATSGLTSFQMKHVYADSINRLGNLDISIINKAKIQEVKKNDKLTYIEPKKTLDMIGGHTKLKDWIQEVKACMVPEAEKFGIQQSNGAIFLGLAGTGKTAIGEAIANYFNVPFIIFNISRMMGGIVGQSENSVREAFETIQSLGNCVVLMDEIDKGVSGVGKDGNAGGQDGGTIARVFGVILENMQKNTGQFYILTANNIDKIPAPLTRSGRLDAKWFFEFPEEKERADIFRIYFKKAGHNIPEDMINFAAKLSNSFTGAEIETAVNNILKRAFLSDKKINKTNISLGIEKVNPIFKTNSEEVNRLKEYAIKNNIPSTEYTIEEKSKKPLSETEINKLNNIQEYFSEIQTGG